MPILQQPLAVGAAAVASLYMAVDLPIARHLRDTGDDTLARTRHTVGQARVLPQSAPLVLVPPVLWHNRESTPSAGTARRYYRGTGF